MNSSADPGVPSSNRPRPAKAVDDHDAATGEPDATFARNSVV
jgi:hypothetical protein